MLKAKYRLTNKALDDLAEIWNYTQKEWSERQADAYCFLLIDSCQVIAENQNPGKNYSNVKKELLGFKANLHIISI